MTGTDGSRRLGPQVRGKSWTAGPLSRDANRLGEAIAATFARRDTAVPAEVPVGLSDEFAQGPSAPAQWKAFLSRNRLDAPPLTDVVAEVRQFVLEPLRLARVRARGEG
jgi:hypothetical protein